MKKFLTYFRKLIHFIHWKLSPISFAKSIGVQLGSNCRLLNVHFGSEPYLVRLGDHVSATDTRFVTHDGGVWVFRDSHPEMDKIAPIVVGNNVYFGSGTIVLPGVVIGDNVVIGAASVVTKDIPSDSVVAGVPAKVVSNLSDYYQKCLMQQVETKSLAESVKRQFLEEKFAFVRGQGGP